MLLEGEVLAGEGGWVSITKINKKKMPKTIHEDCIGLLEHPVAIWCRYRDFDNGFRAHCPMPSR